MGPALRPGPQSNNTRPLLFFQFFLLAVVGQCGLWVDPWGDLVKAGTGWAGNRCQRLVKAGWDPGKKEGVAVTKRRGLVVKHTRASMPRVCVQEHRYFDKSNNEAKIFL